MKRLILALCLLPNTALAYSDASSFAKDPSVETSGGGGGLFFTGSPRQHGLQCESCHVEGTNDTKLRFSALLDGEASPLFASGYQPGVLYEIEVGFEGPDLQPEAGCEGREDEPCNINGFAFEMLDARGFPQAYCVRWPRPPSPAAPPAGSNEAQARLSPTSAPSCWRTASMRPRFAGTMGHRPTASSGGPRLSTKARCTPMSQQWTVAAKSSKMGKSPAIATTV